MQLVFNLRKQQLNDLPIVRNTRVGNWPFCAYDAIFKFCPFFFMNASSIPISSQCDAGPDATRSQLSKRHGMANIRIWGQPDIALDETVPALVVAETWSCFRGVRYHPERRIAGLCRAREREAHILSLSGIFPAIPFSFIFPYIVQSLHLMVNMKTPSVYAFALQ